MAGVLRHRADDRADDVPGAAAALNYDHHVKAYWDWRLYHEDRAEYIRLVTRRLAELVDGVRVRVRVLP